MNEWALDKLFPTFFLDDAKEKCHGNALSHRSDLPNSSRIKRDSNLEFKLQFREGLKIHKDIQLKVITAWKDARIESQNTTLDVYDVLGWRVEGGGGKMRGVHGIVATRDNAFLPGRRLERSRNAGPGGGVLEGKAVGDEWCPLRRDLGVGLNRKNGGSSKREGKAAGGGNGSDLLQPGGAGRRGETKISVSSAGPAGIQARTRKRGPENAAAPGAPNGIGGRWGLRIYWFSAGYANARRRRRVIKESSGPGRFQKYGCHIQLKSGEVTKPVGELEDRGSQGGGGGKAM
ncbi:hypothetical protein B0H16DRAFT_1692167 [Mycena metata]|uniref:Uncharacterized protein n=1 Tax=Mycena metata TaxID=1033252 RepID=A0AAD7ISF8_9AGAR|nr:hypothetical protein B0H16DRAFT_1692167 [Mycena metata]